MNQILLITFLFVLFWSISTPVEALQTLKKYLKEGGTITSLKGSWFCIFLSGSEAAQKAIQCQVELQRKAGGNAMIGRELYPCCVRQALTQFEYLRMVYVDSSKPGLVDGFTKKTFTAMIEGVREQAIKTGLIEQNIFEKGIKDLYRTAEQDGVFCYTFFKQLASNDCW